MTTVDARLAADDFDMSDGGTINYASFNYQTSDRMFLQWNTGNGDVIDAYGGPVYLDGTQFPDHGPVNLLKIDLGGDGDPNTGVGIDVIITPSAPADVSGHHQSRSAAIPAPQPTSSGRRFCPATTFSTPRTRAMPSCSATFATSRRRSSTVST